MSETKRKTKTPRPEPFELEGLSSIALESLNNPDVHRIPNGYYHPCEDALIIHPVDAWQGDPVPDLWQLTAEAMADREYVTRCLDCGRILDADATCECELDPAFIDYVSHDRVGAEVEDDIPLGRMAWYAEFGNPADPTPPRKHVKVVETKAPTAAHIIGEHQDCDFCAITGAYARITSVGLIPSQDVKNSETLITNTLSWDDIRIFPCHAGYNFTRKSFMWFGRHLPTAGFEMPRVSHLPAAVSITVESLANRAREHLASNGYENELLEFVRMPNVSGFIMRKQKASAGLSEAPSVEHRVPLYSIGRYSAFAVAKPFSNATRRVRDFYSPSRDAIGGNHAIASERPKSLCGCGKCWERMLWKDKGLIRTAARTGLPTPYVRVNPNYYEDLLEEIEDAHAQERLTIFILEGDVF